MSEGMSTTEPAGQPIAGATTKPLSAAAALMSSSLPPHETMTYQERRMSGQVAFGYETAGRRRTSSFGSYTRVVVVAVDPSDNARQAFDWYIANIWKLDDLIVLVHCPEAPRLPTLSFKNAFQPPLDDWKRILDEMNSKARRLEEEYEITCTMKKLKHKVRCEAMKNIGEGICRIADDEGADLIVCGGGGSRFSKKGTVCEYIMRNSPIPTVIIPPIKSHF